MRAPIQLIAIAVFIFTLTLRCAASFAQDTIGEVTSVTGTATLQRGGSEVALVLLMPIRVCATRFAPPQSRKLQSHLATAASSFCPSPVPAPSINTR